MAKQWHQLEKLDHKSLKKLQQDREKQALQQKQDADRKRVYIIVASVVIALVCGIVFLSILRNRAAEKAYKEERDKMYAVSVAEVKGPVQGRSIGDWEKISPNFTFNDEYTFKTDKNGQLSVKLQLDNVVKLASMSEMMPPGLAIDSMKIALVRGLTAFSKESMSSGSAQTTFQPKLLNELPNWLIEPP